MTSNRLIPESPTSSCFLFLPVINLSCVVVGFMSDRVGCFEKKHAKLPSFM